MPVGLGDFTKGTGGQRAHLSKSSVPGPPPPPHSRLDPVSHPFPFHKRPAAFCLADVLFVT